MHRLTTWLHQRLLCLLRLLLKRLGAHLLPHALVLARLALRLVHTPGYATKPIP